jgi:hypothetical protein
MKQKSRFALFSSTVAFFSLQAEAREELPKVLEAAGYKVVLLGASHPQI